MKLLKSFRVKAEEDCRTPRQAAPASKERGEMSRERRGVRQSSAAFPRRNKDALTLLEVLVVVAVVAILFGLLIPVHSPSMVKAIRIKCVSNLKQVGLAFRVWEGDHGDHYPMAVYTNKSGEPLYVGSANLFRYFQIMSNELSNPKILVCPADGERGYTTNFTTDFDSSHISYFLGLNADETRPNAFLAGDSNITNGFATKNGVLELTTNQNIGWTRERHHEAGNVALADGSVQQFTSSALKNALKETGLGTNLLLMPENISAK